jgi:hypothetical protein
MAGRNPKPVEDKKHRVMVFVEKKKIDNLTMKKCEELARKAIDDSYEKNIKLLNKN